MLDEDIMVVLRNVGIVADVPVIVVKLTPVTLKLVADKFEIFAVVPVMVVTDAFVIDIFVAVPLRRQRLDAFTVEIFRVAKFKTLAFMVEKLPVETDIG